MLSTALSVGLPLLGVGALVLAVLAGLYLPLIGRGVAIALAVLGAATFAYDAGYRERASLDVSGELRANIIALKLGEAEAQRQALAARQMAFDAADAEQSASLSAEANQQKVALYETLLAHRPAFGCRLTDADVRSLSAIGAGSHRDYASKPPGASGHVRSVRDGARSP